MAWSEAGGALRGEATRETCYFLGVVRVQAWVCGGDGEDAGYGGRMLVWREDVGMVGGCR